MKLTHLMQFSYFGISTILFKRKKPIVGTIIVTDRCNLACKHCSVNNIEAVDYPYRDLKQEMQVLYKMGVRILFFCGGETFLWRDGDHTLRDLVREAKGMGFPIVNVVTNGTHPLDLPEADLILLSLDGGRAKHNLIRGDTFDTIMTHVKEASSDNICFYMAINQLNQEDLEEVAKLAKKLPNVRAVSFNFHTPYPDTVHLSLSVKEKKKCCDHIEQLMDEGYPIFNLKSAFPYLATNNFPTPCYQCVVIERGKVSVCGRCVEIDGLCEQCGYFFAAEYALLFSGHIKVIWEMFTTYTRYV